MLFQALRFLVAVLGLNLVAADLLAGEGNEARPAPMICVDAYYPGANASVLADTVAAPIEQQINGVEGLVQLASRSGNDGRYTLAILFKPGVDLNTAQVLVQNRVALSLPLLPEPVKQMGVMVRKKAPVLMLVAMSSPGGRHDTPYLSSYADLFIKDDLARVAGVGAIAPFGMRDQVLRVRLDPQKLTKRGITAGEVSRALQEQNLLAQPGPAGKIGEPPAAGQQFQFSLAHLGRLIDAREVAELIVKTDAKGIATRVKDVGRVELETAQPGSTAGFDGRPAVVLGVYPLAATGTKQLSRSLRSKLAKYRKALPDSVKLDVIFDASTTADYVLLDLELPPAASTERARAVLAACEQTLRGLQGVQDVLTLTESPFDFLRRPPCLLVRLGPHSGRDEILRTLRTKLDQPPSALLHGRVLKGAGSLNYDYPVEFALTGDEPAKVHALARQLGKRLQNSKKLTDVWINRESAPRPQLEVTIDRSRATAQGVEMKDILATLEVSFGSMYVNDFNRFGRTWQVIISVDAKGAEALKQLKIRNGKGDMIRLGDFLDVRTVQGRAAIHRIELDPAVLVSASPAAETSPSRARALVEAQFAAARRELQLPAAYRLIWRKQ